MSTEDSTKLSSWSNVPYLFCKTLQEQGIEVQRLTVPTWGVVGTFLQWSIRALRFIKIWQKSTWDYSRSYMYYHKVQSIIDKELELNMVDAVLILSFSYSPSLPCKLPLILFGDWSLSYSIECQQSRKANHLERCSIRREHKLLSSASEVFVLFPVAEHYIKSLLPKARTHYIGNVINTVETPDKADIRIKKKGLSLLFIGKSHYLEGAQHLIDTYRQLKETIPGLALNIVGMGKEFFSELPDGVFCHGYLDKGNPIDRALYYELLRGASIFINTNTRWVSFSATLEAMYFYTPIVTTANAELEETFGKQISFGVYFRAEDSLSLESVIRDLLLSDNYIQLAMNAHHAASPYSWKRYVSRFLNIVNSNQ